MTIDAAKRCIVLLAIAVVAALAVMADPGQWFSRFLGGETGAARLVADIGQKCVESAEYHGFGRGFSANGVPWSGSQILAPVFYGGYE